MTSQELLLEKCRDGYKKIIRPNVPKEKLEIYKERLRYELEIINKMGFCDYFLIVWDIVRYAEENGISVGPGRGSAAGSLVSFALGITKLDPIVYNLIFERFLNKDRVSAPDIDIDFCSSGRGKVQEYIRRKYGEDRACSVVTYSKMKVRGLVRDICKATGVDPIHTDKIAKLIDYSAEDVLQVLDEVEALKEWAVKYPEVFDIAINLNGCIKHSGKNAAGMLITKEPLLNCLPIMTTTNGMVISQWDKTALEDLNFLKIDILGLETLDIIDETIKLIGEDVLKDLDLNDKKVYKEFSAGKTECIFQFGTYGMKKLCYKIKPSNIEELAAVNAIIRPGASQGQDFYVQGKETGEIYYFDDERLKDILTPTYGTITYQEQTMAIVQAVAGFSMSKADIVRRAISKPKYPGQLEEVGQEFINGCIKNGQTKEWAENLFAVILQSEKYAFNKSHAVVYALLGYKEMFLKVYYPVEFMTSCLTSAIDKDSEKNHVIDRYEKECKKMGIKVIGWDINTSSSNYTCDVEAKEIYKGLAAIKNVGNAGLEIEKKKPFTSFSDFYTRVNKTAVRSNAITALIDSGAFDSIESDRSTLRKYVGSPSAVRHQIEDNQGSLFS